MQNIPLLVVYENKYYVFTKNSKTGDFSDTLIYNGAPL